MDLSTLPAIGYASRADAIRRRLSERGLNALAVSDMTNLRWLTGFTGSSALVVLLPDRLVLVTDGRYADRAQAEMAAAGVDAEIRVGFTQAQQHDLFVDACTGAGEIGADAAKLSHQRWQAWSKEIAIVPADGVVEDARRVKDAGEVARIAAAAGCADRALADVAPMLAGRPTEADVRTELEYRMRRHGADGPSYDTIVASGPHHAARPHHQVGRPRHRGRRHRRDRRRCPRRRLPLRHDA